MECINDISPQFGGWLSLNWEFNKHFFPVTLAYLSCFFSYYYFNLPYVIMILCWLNNSFVYHMLSTSLSLYNVFSTANGKWTKLNNTQCQNIYWEGVTVACSCISNAEDRYGAIHVAMLLFRTKQMFSSSQSTIYNW